MKILKSSKSFAALALTLSLLPINGQAQVQAQQGALASAEQMKLLAEMMAKSGLSQAEQVALKLQVLQFLGSILNVNPLTAAQTKTLNPLDINDLSQVDTTPQETKILRVLADMIDKKTLKQNINKLIEEIKNSPTPLAQKVASLPDSQKEYAINSLTASIEAVTKMRGLTKDSAGQNYKEWSKLSKYMRTNIAQTKPGNILALANSNWVNTESAEILVNGPASFAKRDQFMSEAQDSINILTWSIYDDLTGTQAVDLLLQKKKDNPNLKIRVIVDGQVAATSGHNTQVKRLEDGGVEVIRWFSSKLSYVGQHRKMLIVDNTHMIAGGLNFGDVYSHKNPDLSVKRWRDTDIYIKGAGAEEGNRLFAKLWNEQLQMQPKLKYQKITMGQSAYAQQTPGSIDIAVINNDPTTSKEGSTIMLTLLKAIREAKQQIDIENAYIILFPALKQEIQAAIGRGVKVRVFTNSSESVDEPVVSIPILRSVTEFFKMGAQVFVKKGATLHSKIAVIDSDLSLIMSYNLHPRSERVEGEMAIAVHDVSFATRMHDMFDQDVTADKADEIKSNEDIKMPNSPVSIPTLRLFFDML